MQMSYGLTCGHGVASTPSQYFKNIQTFSGLCKECYLPLRGGRVRSQLCVRILLDTCNGKPWEGYEKFLSRDSFEACWKEFNGKRVARSGNSTIESREGQGNCMHEVLEKPSRNYYSGLKGAARYACNDAKIVNARAREGFVLLARGFQRLDRRARQDVALLGSGFSKLDARVRQDTVKLDSDARRNAAQLRRIAVGLTDKAQVQLKIAADKHWSDGALDADLRLADLRAKRRAMEDAFMALQFVKSIHNGMVKRAYQRQNELEILTTQQGSLQNEYPSQLNGSDAVMYDRLAALQDAYWDIASALAEADGIDYSDPEELELIIATLLDMNAVDGASSATMLAEWAKSPDVATRQALANALGNAPSLWALGNAGMGALQRLALDDNLAVAAAASKALEELKKQWHADAQDMLIFHADSSFLESLYSTEEDNDDED